jgi:hypothetical protein
MYEGLNADIGCGSLNEESDPGSMTESLICDDPIPCLVCIMPFARKKKAHQDSDGPFSDI